MASTEHTVLSNTIKCIHEKLRVEAKVLGTEQAWKKHCENEENLEKYSKAMQELAVNHWDKNPAKDSKVVSRVLWVYEACKTYFQDIEKFLHKEVEIMKTFFTKDIHDLHVWKSSFCDKLRLLDVGSCYNPFKQFDIFDVTAIDIAPANSGVFKCDFLKVNIQDSIKLEENKIVELPKGFFQVVVFSLLLEYLPSPELRLKCCEKAYKLLQREGILVIITPDSNHVGSNAKIIKSWRYALAKIGFIRVKYAKLPHIHCMVFRKATFVLVAQRWAEVHESEGLFDKIYIPQDFKEDIIKDKDDNLSVGEKWCSDTFLEGFFNGVLD